ncbi:hypothetical protein CCACVL1_24928 [Corchorus capsularis]|uniref:Transmembrane protein n=1 Tax=Corchorus capsularis TaxID=210143 RepID=A0A1R3GMH1_COCAP|nr:hypothetical protein CCACVL1_24928 [Corchorus capsularis]
MGLKIYALIILFLLLSLHFQPLFADKVEETKATKKASHKKGGRGASTIAVPGKAETVEPAAKPKVAVAVLPDFSYFFSSWVPCPVDKPHAQA